MFSIGLSAFPGNDAVTSAQLSFEFAYQFYYFIIVFVSLFSFIKRRYSTDEARKVAKELLQANRTSLSLCGAFANLELSAGNIASSIKVPINFTIIIIINGSHSFFLSFFFFVGVRSNVIKL